MSGGPGDGGVPLIDRVTDAFFALDGQWRFTYVNDRAARMLDRPAHELVGRVIWDEFPETVETQFPAEFHEAMETGDPVSFEVYHAGVETWFEARAYPGGGGLSVSFRDITERKQQTDELDRAAEVIEAAHDGVLTFDGDGRIAYVNEAVEALMGADRDTLRGTRAADLAEVGTITEKSAGDVRRALAEFADGREEERRFNVTFRLADGARRVADLRLLPLGPGEDGVSGVLRDVTERHEHSRVVKSLHAATRRFARADSDEEVCSMAVGTASELLDLPISGIWLLDGELDTLSPVAATGGAHEKMGGLPSFPENEGPVWAAYRSGESVLYDDLRKETDTDEGAVRSELIVPIGDHGVLMAGATTVGAFDENDRELAEILAANVEVELDRADHERLLEDHERTVERQAERLTAIETVLHRDLAAYLDVAAEVSADDTVREALSATDRLVEDAVELARGRASVGTRSSVDLAAAVEDACAQVASSENVDPGAVTVTVEGGGSLRADRGRLVRMFETLFHAALARSAREGDPAVRVRVGTVTESVGPLGGAERVVGFFVEDDGPSLSALDRERLFDLETVVEARRRGEDPAASVTSDGGSDGLHPGATWDHPAPELGPAVARKIAEAHGWSVSVEDGDGSGVRIEVTGVATLAPEN